MSNAPHSTPLAVPGFKNTDTTPDAFLKFLQSLAEEYLGDNKPMITSQNKGAWVAIINGLTDHLLGPFPLPDLVAWNKMKEKVVLTEATLEVIRRAFLRVEGIYNDSQDIARKLFVRLLDFRRVLEVWMGNEVVCDEDTFTPAQMKDKSDSVLIPMLQGLGNTVPAATDINRPTWKTLKDILQESVDVCNDLLTRPTLLTDSVILSYFNNPKIVVIKEQDLFEEELENSFSKIVVSPVHISSFVVTAMDVVFRTMASPLKCQWYLTDILRLCGEICRATLLHILDPSNPTKNTTRVNVLVHLFSITTTLRSKREYEPIFGDFLEYFMHIRLETNLGLEWDVVDAFLIETFKREKHLQVSLALACSVVHRLQLRNWAPNNNMIQELLWTYLRSIIPVTNAAQRDMLTEIIQNVDECPERKGLLDSLSGLRDKVEIRKEDKPKTYDARIKFPPHVWRQQVQDLVQEIIAPDSLSWMDVEDTPSTSHVCKRSLFELQLRFEQRPPELKAIDKSSIISKLSDLPCLLAQCDKTNCFDQTTNNEFIEVRPYMPLMHHLLDILDPPEHRRRVYLALASILKHHSGLEDLQSVVDLLFCGVMDSNRSVRVSAGQALNALVQTCSHNVEVASNVLDPIFTRLFQYFEQSKNPVRETLLITVGLMGRTKSQYVLGQVLCLLIAQLGRQNPVVKGSAFMQLTSLAKHSRKATYAMCLPYIEQIASYIVKQLPVQPNLLLEACRAFSMSTSDFLILTLPRTLPEIFANCDQKRLDLIALEIRTKISSLFLRHSHAILAHILLLPTDAAVNKGLKLVLKITNADSQEPIDIHNIIKSCLSNLIAELVITLGHADEGMIQRAVMALQRLENILMNNKKDPNYKPDLVTFLQHHILGLITSINSMLQDFHGKKSAPEKCKILRGIGGLVDVLGSAIVVVAPQIMATFQTMVYIPELAEATLYSWYKFLTTLSAEEIGHYIGATSASIVGAWPSLPSKSRETAFQSLEYIVCTMGPNIQQYLVEIVDLSTVEEFRLLQEKLQELRGNSSADIELDRILNQILSDNINVAAQALRELKSFMLHDHKDYMRALTIGDMFDSKIERILSTLITTACRDDIDGTETLHLLSFECLGVLGAIDPDRCETPQTVPHMVVMKNFQDENETIALVLHFLRDILVGTYRSTSDVQHQNHLAYCIQKLLDFCDFTSALVSPTPSKNPVSIKVRNRWNALPKHVLETVTPLLGGRFTVKDSSTVTQHPIYPIQATYREWIQNWTTHLITRTVGENPTKIFGSFRSAIRNKDVVVAHHILPHVVLHILLSGNEDDSSAIRIEMLSVLEDHVNPQSNSTSDKKLLSTQVVFMLLDHLQSWIRLVRQELSAKKEKRNRGNHVYEDQLTRVDSILSNIDPNLMAQAAFHCKAYARALMSYEQHIVLLKERGVNAKELPGYYEKLHELYSHLDEPDGMEGVSKLILSPTLEHQTRQHESKGAWTAAQSCWELRLQETPDNVELHIGLLRCLRNLGHYDTLRTHITGVLTRHPEWESALAHFQAECAWMVGDWTGVQQVVDRNRAKNHAPPMVIAPVLLAMRTGDKSLIYEALSRARSTLGSPITAAGVKGYRRSYEAVLDLHMTHELELIYQATSSLTTSSQDANQRERRRTMADLSEDFAARLNITLPTFRTREPLLSMRRTAFILSKNDRSTFAHEIGNSWLASAKIARKAGHIQTAYTAMLYARECKIPFAFIDEAKLVKASGDHVRAFNELVTAMTNHGYFDNNVVDLTEDKDAVKMKAKLFLLRARWMHDINLHGESYMYKIFESVTDIQKDWENAYYYLGAFHDECFKALDPADTVVRGLRMNQHTVKSFSRAVSYGSKFIYQAMPRMLTIWLDLGENKEIVGEEHFLKMTEHIANVIQVAHPYKWYTAFPQIVSRITHDNKEIFKHLKNVILKVMFAYPHQAIWLFISALKSNNRARSQRGLEILTQAKNYPQGRGRQMYNLVNEYVGMADQLLALCNKPVSDGTTSLSMMKDFPKLYKLGTGRSNVIIPLQESLGATLPLSNSREDSAHEPFPKDVPTFGHFADEIDVMKSLAKPRKITITGSNGQTYSFLGKPKDDLRKDARLMDLYAIINKLLKGNSESRRRQLHIRTYGVVALNEECGFIQWVPNTIPIRYVLIKHYAAKGLPQWSTFLANITNRLNNCAEDVDRTRIFTQELLPVYKPIFHEWFIEMFPEPSAWLASRLTYGRTAAVMSMVGFIIGLGDRHLENILLDTNTADVIHVDFNCLFDRGKNLDTPERVPFRLTQNIVDGLGVSGVEGVFRIACEVTLQLLRDNKDPLMSVLDAFVHDPLVEWEEEKRKMTKKYVMDLSNLKRIVGAGGGARNIGDDGGGGKTAKARERERNDRETRLQAQLELRDLERQGPPNVDTKTLAKNSLIPIEKKLKGMYVPMHSLKARGQRVMSSASLVEILIQEAMDNTSLAKMYMGWAPWH